MADILKVIKDKYGTGFKQLENINLYNYNIYSLDGLE